MHPPWQVLRHFWSPVPWMLEATIALQLAIGERVEEAMIAALLLLNVALGVYQETRANAALALLKQRLSLKARVRRDGVWQECPAADLVPGDIVQLSLCAVVPADLRLVAGSVLIDQSTLTGEAMPVETGPADTAFAGGLVRRGRAFGETENAPEETRHRSVNHDRHSHRPASGSRTPNSLASSAIVRSLLTTASATFAWDYRPRIQVGSDVLGPIATRTGRRKYTLGGAAMAGPRKPGPSGGKGGTQPQGEAQNQVAAAE